MELLLLKILRKIKYDCDIKTLICGHEFTKFHCRLLNTIYNLQEKCYLKNIFEKKIKKIKIYFVILKNSCNFGMR